MVAIFRQRFARIQHFVQIEKKELKNVFLKRWAETRWRRVSKRDVEKSFNGVSRRRRPFVQMRRERDQRVCQKSALLQKMVLLRKWQNHATERVWRMCVCVWERERERERVSVCVCAFGRLLSEGEKCESACLSKSPISSLWLWRQLRTPSVRSRTFQSCSVQKKSRRPKLK